MNPSLIRWLLRDRIELLRHRIELLRLQLSSHRLQLGMWVAYLRLQPELPSPMLGIIRLKAVPPRMERRNPRFHKGSDSLKQVRQRMKPVSASLMPVSIGLMLGILLVLLIGTIAARYWS